VPSHEREQLRAETGHIRASDHREGRTHVSKASANADERPAVSDVIASETRRGRVRRKRKLRCAGGKDDHDLIAGSEERAERTVEEWLAFDRLDHLLAAETRGRAARQQDAL